MHAVDVYNLAIHLAFYASNCLKLMDVWTQGRTCQSSTTCDGHPVPDIFWTSGLFEDQLP